MKIFIDFDDVLFNTKKFRKDFEKIFKDSGITKEIFDKYYYTYPDKISKGVIQMYNPEKHLERIEKKAGIRTEQLGKKIKKFILDTSAYIFSDSFNFLDKFDKQGLFLVSFGKADFQNKKIYNSGLKKYFKKIIITDKLKAKIIQKTLGAERKEKDEKIFFIDDRIEQMRSVKKENKKIITILLQRKEGRYKDACDKYCDQRAENLKETLKIIKTKNGE